MTDPKARLSGLVDTALALADDLGLTDVGIRLDQARVALSSGEARAEENALISREPEGSG